jgi:hypothetical protein
MTTPQAIKALIVKHIGTLLGTYYPDNVPSIYIGSPPANFSCKGLEVFIPSYPQYSRSKANTRDEKWEITLTQYQPITTVNIHQATDILRDNLTPTPECIFLDRVLTLSVPDDLPLLPQCIIRYEVYESVHLKSR